MKFEDIERDMWIRYKDKYWFVYGCDEQTCYLGNGSDDLEITVDDLKQYSMELVQPPIFQQDEQVVYIGTNNRVLHNTIVKVTEVSQYVKGALPYYVESDKSGTWSTPFELQKLDY